MNAVFATDYFKSLDNRLGRGINMGNMLEAPREGEWGVRLDEAYFKTIAEAGFQNVRIPTKWSSRTAKEPPYTIDPEFLSRVERAVDAALAAGLQVILNIHHYEEVMQDPAGQKPRFEAIWRQIAERFRDRPEALWFELLNEPMGKLTAGPWNEMIRDVIPIIRQTNPERWIVVGPPNWNSVDALSQLELPATDRRLAVTFHYYSPFQFTHQGAGWVGEQSKQWLGTKWTGSQAEQQAIIRQFDEAITWAVEQQRPLYLGEFGAYSTADMESRERWTRFVADQAVARKMGFAYWEFASGFGAWDPQAKAWREPLLKALTGAE
jgi:endoglucanase